MGTLVFLYRKYVDDKVKAVYTELHVLLRPGKAMESLNWREAREKARRTLIRLVRCQAMHVCSQGSCVALSSLGSTCTQQPFSSSSRPLSYWP